MSEVLECMKLEVQAFAGADDISDEEYAPVQRPTSSTKRHYMPNKPKEITLVRKKKYSPNYQRGNNKKGATFRDLLISSSSRNYKNKGV